MVCLLCGTIRVRRKQENRLRSILKVSQITHAARHCLPYCQSLLHSSYEICLILEMNDGTIKKTFAVCFCGSAPPVDHPQCRDSSIVLSNNKSCLPHYLIIPCNHVCFGVLRDLSSGKLEINPLKAELNPICHLLALLGGATIVVVSRLRVKRSVLVNAYRFLYNKTN